MLEQLFASLVSTFLSLFPIANPVGAIPIFYSLTANHTPSYRGRQARATAINVVWVLIVFLLAGRLILEFFGISLGVLKIAGGLLVSHTAWEMVTVSQRLSKTEGKEAVNKEDISFVPMAVPLVSGPGAIGVVISQGAQTHQWIHYLGCSLGIVLLGITLYFCLALGQPLIESLGSNGIGALNRVLGFFILAISVQLIADGVLTLLQESLPSLFQSS